MAYNLNQAVTIKVGLIRRFSVEERSWHNQGPLTVSAQSFDLRTTTKDNNLFCTKVNQPGINFRFQAPASYLRITGVRPEQGKNG